MFDKMIPIVHKDSLLICDLDDTFFTKGYPCKFTDLDGFIQLFKHVKGNIIFLTGHPSKQEIKDRFKTLKLNYHDFTIFYCNIPKGLFLKKFRYPPRTVFIDNSRFQIKSVRKYCPDIQCIHFNQEK